MAQLLDGKATAKAVRGRLKKEIRLLTEQVGHPPQAVFIQVGDDPASTTYVNTKHKMATRIGCLSTIDNQPTSITQDGLLDLIANYNTDPAVHAILTQLPLPGQINESAIVQAIDPRKDVDCFHPENAGRLLIGLPGPKPATPLGILTLLDAYGIDVKGMNITVLGRSNLVGKPLGLMLLKRHGTVTYCHTRTRDLAGECRRADLLIAAAGRAGIVTADMVKRGAIVVDVGTNFMPKLDEAGQPMVDKDGNAQRRLVGDVDFAQVEPVAGWISPVPGGVGPMTIASVLSNAVTLFKLIEGVAEN